MNGYVNETKLQESGLLVIPFIDQVYTRKYE